MATRQQIEHTYNYLDDILRASMGDAPDLSGAFYNGDYSQTLDEAQRAKYEYVLSSLKYEPEARILDIGCGWGPFLSAVRQCGGRGVGITLSTRQWEACRHQALDAHLLDWRDLTRQTFGPFDGIASLGAFEHFCSKEEYLGGEQSQVYGRFFGLCDQLLPAGGRLFLQTMIWGDHAPRTEEISFDAERTSPGYLVAMLSKFYPGSWLPESLDQIVRSAQPHFKLVSSNNGWRDYIETMLEWRKLNDIGRIRRLGLRKLWLAAKALRYALRDADFFPKIASLRGGYQRQCFERRIIDHQRLVFEKVT